MKVRLKIKDIRKSIGLTQTQFAELLNTTQQRVSEWEANKVEPGLTSLIKIMKVLNVNFDELYEEINNENSLSM